VPRPRLPDPKLALTPIVVRVTLPRMAARKDLVAETLVDFGPLLDGWGSPVTFGVGWDGAIYAAAGRATEPLTENRGIGIFPKSKLAESTDYVVLRWEQGKVQKLVHSRESLVASYVQPYPGGVLLVGARCRWRPEGAEKNALALDWSGRELRRLTLGDGIQDLRVTTNGAIWASYFDEGVFGNFGWSRPGPRAMGAAGLLAFSPEGEQRFAYDAEAAGTDSICDAYAMNVAGDDDVWLYFYTEFPIVRLLKGAYHVWELGIGGARALAVRQERVLLFGDYERRNLGRLVELGTNKKATVAGEANLVDEEGNPLTDAVACGVGEALYFFQGRRVLLVEGW
jgi:hypothetical protein